VGVFPLPLPLPRLGWFGGDALRRWLTVLVVSDSFIAMTSRLYSVDAVSKNQLTVYTTVSMQDVGFHGLCAKRLLRNLPLEPRQLLRLPDRHRTRYLISLISSVHPARPSADHPVTMQLSSTSTPRAASASTSPPSPRPISQRPTPSAASAPSTAPSPTSTPPCPCAQSRAATTSTSATSSKATDNCKSCVGRTRYGMIGSSSSTAKVPSSSPHNTQSSKTVPNPN